MLAWLHFVPWHWLLWLSVPFVALAGGLTFASAETAALLRKVPVSWWVCAVLIFAGSLYHVGTVASAADGAATAQAAKDADKLATATKNESTCADTLKNVNAQTALDKAAAEERAKTSAAMVKQISAEAVLAETALADARQKLADAAHSPNCATTASLHFCDAMKNY